MSHLGVDASPLIGRDLFPTPHLNPAYHAQIRRQKVIVVDDYTTYVISLAVARAFLHASGAASVSGIASGNFGNQLGYHDIVINPDPFQPVGSDQFQLMSRSALPGGTDGTAEQTLLALQLRNILDLFNNP
ncbi:hypothetical protein BW687_001710 [Pseudomonas graminis]|uniref:hypothetical protein n=1 Tax=Pseudomonas graminis TaxID=158627 RepID=UPI0023493A76|nr:hypothetical protein [Pseudomonas graminis]MDC6378891.1 hypothetical protein [Pseudomonas graminis]